MELWGIINITPDSFYSASRVEEDDFLKRALLFYQQGAHKLDIGAESTRPGAESLSWQQEWQRLETPLTNLKNKIGEEKFRQTISVDTRHPQTAQKVLELGVGVINDVSGGNREMFLSVAEYNAEIVIMHSTSLPVNLKEEIKYNDVVQTVFDFLQKKTSEAQAFGVKAEHIIWDYGIGFGKNLQDNLRLLASTKKFKSRGHRLMSGISRKSFLHHLLEIPQPQERLVPTMVASAYLSLQGVDILRTHDIHECAQMNTLLSALNSYAE